jgi:23S rRNA (adenine2503-C2)-methyltransferase
MRQNKKQHLLGLSRPELESFVAELDEKPFRGRQLYHWLYVKKASCFADMSDLAKSLREKLEQAALPASLELVSRQTASNKTTKYLFRLADGAMIESVFIPEAGRRTICISSQVGCGYKCSFCATGTMGLKRNLTAGEIVDQVLSVERDTKKTLTNVVLMGMGEPFHNYDNVIKACRLLNDPDGMAIAGRHIVISTVGLVPAIYRYADEGHPYRLAISLHTAVEEKRRRLLPVARVHGLADLMAAVRYYSQKARQRLTFEYVLLGGVNDSESDARALRSLLHGIPCKVNLIPYNAAIPSFQAPSAEQVDQFARWLLPLKAPVSVRWSKGSDIQAACGQLVVEAQSPSA